MNISELTGIWFGVWLYVNIMWHNEVQNVCQCPWDVQKAALFKPISFNCARSSVQEAAFQKHALFDVLISYSCLIDLFLMKAQ